MRWSFTKSTRKRLRWLVLGAGVLLARGFTYAGRPANDEMAFLRRFPYTLQVDRQPGDKVNTFLYHLKGNQAAIRAAIPGASSATAQPSTEATIYDFNLPSGKHATLVTLAGTTRATLVVQGRPQPMWVRALQRIGLR